MKRQKRLLVLTGVLAACVVIAFGISRINFEEKMTGEETAIVDVDAADITGLSWNYENEEMEFSKEDDEWVYDKDGKMAVDQDLLSEIAENLSSITSDKKVEEPQSMSVYGLDEPEYNISVRTKSETYKISVGDQSYSDGEIYISNGDGYVYLTSSELLDHIAYSLLDCVQLEEVPDMESISQVSIGGKADLTMVYKEKSGYTYSDAYTYYMKEGDEYKALDNDSTSELFDTLSGIAWNGCVDYYAEDAELKSYGLDAPDGTVSITYVPAEKDDEGSGASDKKEFKYYVGEADGAYYARLKNSRIIYNITEEAYSAVADASYESLEPDEVILLDWDTVDSIEAEIDGSVYTVEMEKDDDDGYSYTVDGVAAAFDNVIDAIDGLTIASDESDESESAGGEEEDTIKVPEEKPDADGRDVELKLTFHRNTEENSKIELTFYRYNGSWCVSSLNGEYVNYTDRESVVDLKEAINSAILNVK